MKVYELIEKLQQLDQEADVIIYNPDIYGGLAYNEIAESAHEDLYEKHGWGIDIGNQYDKKCVVIR